jgi:Zn-dependent peptidase ImmA (M78 family)/transcriptional regulator with XRE-family HTH domain
MQLAENLRRIRSAKKISQVELAEKTGISRMGYRKIEAGESAPRGETLMAIARALEVRVQELLVPVRPLKRVRFRAQKKLHNRDQLLASVARQLDHYELLEELLGDRPPSVLTALRSDVAKLRGDSRAKVAAERARKAFGLGAGDLIRDICGLLEDNGVKVLTSSVATDGFFGMSVSDDDGGPAVVINTWDRISVERWIFTATHELGHLLLHLNAYEGDQTAEDDQQEKEADTFASYFLMPDETFKAELREAAGLSAYDRVLKLKRIFRVSHRTVLYRIASELPVKQRPNVWIRFNADYKRRNGRRLPGTVEPDGLPPDVFLRRPADKGAEEPERLDRHDFMQDRLARLVRQALEQDAITFSKAAEVLELDLSSMRELANSWVD